CEERTVVANQRGPGGGAVIHNSPRHDDGTNVDGDIRSENCRRVDQGPEPSAGGQNPLGNEAPSGVRPNTNHELMAVDVSQECAPNGSENDATSLLGCRVVVQESDYILASRPGNIGHDTTMAATPDDDEGVVIQEYPSRTP